MSAPNKSSGGAGVIIGVIAALAAVIGIVVAVVLLKKPSATAEDGDAGLIALPGSGAAVVASDGPPDGGGATDAGAGDAGVKVVNNVVPPGTSTAKVPAVDAKAEAECKSAEGLAAGGNVAPAVSHFRNCDGPGKVAARVAIDQAAQRAAAKGCSGLRDAQAAASIGAQTALNNLKAKKCSR